ncbi:hypothetical protein KFZ76_04390 [Methylovulum psychrotolerans]|uniref:hypothetical protein n=1 Tax=Methylovulum psychrotolerans TaxID=1704499 RepID=UPI001BFF7710|nr:hypothetical protein [Methylovulum psychrotolerans]MBT9096952.1 hypothetical protein [Methylovulum psychrotolerans]
MFIFIGLSLALCFLLQAESPWLAYLVSPWVLYGGLAVALGCTVAMAVDKGWARLWHDLFSGSVLLVWYAYWQPLFKDDTPVFFAYALYFVFMAAFIELFFIGQRENIDKEVLRQLQVLAQNFRVKSWMVMLLVLYSLDLLEHYMLYPVAMTLLMARFALSTYLQVETAKKPSPRRQTKNS